MTVPVDTDGLTAASITGAVQSTADWLRRLADIALNLSPTRHVVGAGGEPAFAGGCSPIGSSEAPLRFWADALGQLHIEGSFHSPGSSTTGAFSVFTLPTGFIPAKDSYGNAILYGGTAQNLTTQVGPDGSVSISNPATVPANSQIVVHTVFSLA